MCQDSVLGFNDPIQPTSPLTDFGLHLCFCCYGILINRGLQDLDAGHLCTSAPIWGTCMDWILWHFYYFRMGYFRVPTKENCCSWGNMQYTIVYGSNAFPCVTWTCKRNHPNYWNLVLTCIFLRSQQNIQRLATPWNTLLTLFDHLHGTVR